MVKMFWLIAIRGKVAIISKKSNDRPILGHFFAKIRDIRCKLITNPILIMSCSIGYVLSFIRGIRKLTETTNQHRPPSVRSFLDIKFLLTILYIVWC